MVFPELLENDDLREAFISAYQREGLHAQLPCPSPECPEDLIEKLVWKDGMKREVRCTNCRVDRQQWVKPDEGEIDADAFPLYWNLEDVNSSHEKVLVFITWFEYHHEVTE